MSVRGTLIGVGIAAAAFVLSTALVFAMLAFKAGPHPMGTGLKAELSAIRLDAATTGIRWAGYSTNTYNGTLSGTARVGLRAANEICNANYAGSHWATSDNIIRLGTKYPWTQNAWLADYWYDQTKDCGHFSSNSSSQRGTNASTVTIFSAGTNSGWTCSNSLYLACVYEP